MIRWLVPWVCLGLMGANESSVAPPPGPTITTITLQPATVPRPSLKYHLVPERYGLIGGNAALFYHRANLLIALRQNGEAGQPRSPTTAAQPRTDERLVTWAGKRVADLPREEVRTFLASFDSVLREVEAGAKRDHCDWEFSHRDEGIDLLLPEIQNSRTLARLVELKAKLAIADGRLVDAFEAIQTGFVLARHVADGPTLVQTLIGDSIGFEMIRCLEALIDVPGAPSLFWALADRPRPFVDLRSAFEAERHMIEKEFPDLLEIDRGVWSVERARRFADRLQAKLFNLVAGETLPGLDTAIPTHASPTLRRLGVAALCARIEPEARRSLVLGGRAKAEVDAMPVVQAAMLFVHETTRDRRDAMFRWANVPYPVAATLFKPTGYTRAEKQANPLLAIFSVFDPGIDSARLAAVRLDRQLDALQVVEAIRLDATRHDGRLPARLDAIADLPIPLDPATGKPFDYRVDGDTATVSAPSVAEVGLDPWFAIQIQLVVPRR